MVRIRGVLSGVYAGVILDDSLKGFCYGTMTTHMSSLDAAYVELMIVAFPGPLGSVWPMSAGTRPH